MTGHVHGAARFAGAFRLGALVAAAAVVNAGCGRAEKSELASLGDAVERFQRADNPGRPAAAPAVAAVKCETPAVRPACVACTSAVTDTSLALRLKSQVEQRLDDYGAGRAQQADLRTEQLDQKLAEAARLLELGRTEMENCDGLLRALRSRYAP